MSISFFEYALWASGVPLYGSLAFLLYRRSLLSHAPLFSAWISEMFVSAVLLFVVNRIADRHAYTVAFWILTLVELGLQLGAALEFGRLCFRRQGTRTKAAVRSLAAGLISATVISGSIVISAKPATTDYLDVFYVRIHLLSSLLTLFSTFVVFAASAWFSCTWQKVDYKRFLGFAVFACASAMTDTLHTYWRTESAFSALELFRLVISQAVLVYWLAVLRPFSDELMFTERQNLAHLRSMTRTHLQQDSRLQDRSR